MNLLLTASGEGQPGGLLGSWGTVLFLVAMIAIFYLFFIRPQRKQEKETQAMRNNLSIGDEIVTIGGIIGIIISISSEDTVTIVTSRDRTRIHILKSAISKVTVPVNAPDDKASDKPAKVEKAEVKEDKKTKKDK